MSKKKRIIIIISIITFAMLLVGGTFAWLIFDGALVFGNSQAQSSCFVIDYDYTNDDGTMDLSGTLMQTSVPKTGLSGKVRLGIHPDCSDTMGEGTIYLNVASADNPLLQPVAKAHCENPLTLQTMKNYTTSSACTAEGYTWVSNKPALKYAVYEDIDSNPVSVGYIDKTGDITLYDEFIVYGSKIPYYIYIWLDGELANNSYMNVNFTGNIHLEVEQTEGLEGEAYAIYSADDNSLRFYRSTTPITVGSTYEGRTVTNVYTGFETGNNVPWYNSQSATSVIVEDIIAPVSTAQWFLNFENCTYIDVKKLNTSKVTDMSSMFEGAGMDSQEFVIIGMENWDTSSVRDMSHMFAESLFAFGNSITEIWNIGNISNWDVSNVTNMNHMFENAGVNSTNDWLLDLSDWDVSNVNYWTKFNYYSIFLGSSGENSKIIVPTWNTVDEYYAVYSADDNSLRFYDKNNTIIQGETFNSLIATKVYSLYENLYYGVTDTPWYGIRENITNIIFEDTVRPRNMDYWFNGFYNATNINLTNLDVSDVISMSHLFSGLGKNVTNLNISNLKNWDTSKVQNMSYMFEEFGYSSNSLSLDLSGWDTSNVTSMGGMFEKLGYSSNFLSLDLSGWDTSNVIDMSGMFYETGSSATTFDIQGLSGWDTSNVISMIAMFYYAGSEATTFNIGNLGSWDTSNVIVMEGMFEEMGYNANNWSLDLSGWNVSKVTNHTDFNKYVETKVISPNFS